MGWRSGLTVDFWAPSKWPLLTSMNVLCMLMFLCVLLVTVVCSRMTSDLLIAMYIFIKYLQLWNLDVLISLLLLILNLFDGANIYLRSLPVAR